MTRLARRQCAAAFMGLAKAGLFLCCLACVTPASAQGADTEYPKDPFEERYLPPRARELGTTPGQLRLLASGGLLFEGGGVASVLQLSGELMMTGFLGIRASTSGTLFDFSAGGLPLWMWQLGPSLHLRPYERVDLGAYFEAGPALVREAQRSAMPALSGGLFLDVSLSSYWYLQAEGRLTWGLHSRAGASHAYLGPAGLLGLGVQL